MAEAVEPIRWGICGTGAIADQFATALAEVDDADLVAVASEDVARGGGFANRHDVPAIHIGYDAMAADDSVDVVYVASTQQRHKSDVLCLLAGGRAVLCEKPFALSLADATAMFDAALASGLFLMEAMWSRFLPSYQRLHELLIEGAIGTPSRLEADFSIRVPDHSVAGHRLFDPTRGGGALFDLGVYPVQLAHLVFGAPTAVNASARLTELGVDEQTALLVDHEGGGMSLLSTAIRTQGTCTARIAGSDGVIGIDAFMHCPMTLHLDRGLDSETFEFDQPSLRCQVPEVHRCLRAGLKESPMMPAAETLAIMATLDSARGQIGLEFNR